MSWFDDSYLEWSEDAQENFSTHYYGDVLLNEDEREYVDYDSGQNSAIYPPSGVKVNPPSPPPPTNPPSPPRVKRPHNPPPVYPPDN